MARGVALRPQTKEDGPVSGMCEPLTSGLSFRDMVSNPRTEHLSFRKKSCSVEHALLPLVVVVAVVAPPAIESGQSIRRVVGGWRG